MKKAIFKIHRKLELVTSKWWFGLVILILFFIPPYTTKIINSEQIADVVISVLSNALIYTKPILFPLFKILPLILFFLLLKYKNKVTRIFSAYVTFNLLIVAIFQNMAYTKDYGFAILTGNLIVSLIVSLAWLWEAIITKNDFEKINVQGINYLIVFLSFIAYWYPINMETLNPDFNLLYLMTSEAGVTFCMLVPIYLTFLILIYPKVNKVTLKITSLVGFIIGILNIVQFFILNPFLWWMGILHLPQLFIAFYGLVLTRKDQQMCFNSKRRNYYGK